MPEISYIRHEDEKVSNSTRMSPNDVKSHQMQKKRENEEDEFLTEDGFVAFVINVHNILIVSHFIHHYRSKGLK